MPVDNAQVSIKAIVLDLGSQQFILDVAKIDQRIIIKMNHRTVAVKISAVLTFILSGKFRVMRYGDVLFVDGAPLVRQYDSAIKSKSHTFIWVHIAKQRGWSMLHIIDFLLALAQIWSMNTEFINESLDCILDVWTKKKGQDFFSKVEKLVFRNNIDYTLKCMYIILFFHIHFHC